MEHRDQRHENHGVHICNKCGWPFPNPHPSARHRRAHKRVCGKIEGYKTVESEANTHLTLSDDERVADDDLCNSSPKVLERSGNDKGIGGIGKKSKESEDEVFSDAVAEFSERALGVETNKPMGDASDSVTTMKVVAKDKMNGSQTSKDTEIADLVPSSSSSTENRKVENPDGAENAINQSGLGAELESKSNHEFVNLVTDFRTGESVIMLGDHMRATTTGDLYPIEPETVIVTSKQERYINSVEDVPQCSLISPDRRYDEKKNESFSLERKLPEIAVSTGNIDIDKSEPVMKMEEAVAMPTEPTAPNVSLLSKANNDMFIHSEITPSDVVPDVKSVDLTRITLDAGKEIQSCSSNNLLETSKIKEVMENVHLLSMSGDLNVVDHPEALVKDFKDHREVKLTDFAIQDPGEGDNGSEDNFRNPIPEKSCSTFQAKPFNQASKVNSFDMQMVENRQKWESGGKKVAVDGEVDYSKNSDQKVEEMPVQEVDATQNKGILCEDKKQDKSQILSDAGTFGKENIHSVCFSPEAESIAPSKNSSLDNFTKNVTEIMSNENSIAAPLGNQMNLNDLKIGIAGGCLAEDDEAGLLGRNLEDSVQVHLPANMHERDDNCVCEKDKFDSPDVAGVECKRGPLEENFPRGINSINESTTNSKENKCLTIAEEIADGSPRKLSGPESTDLRKCDISLGFDPLQSVKEDCDSAVPVACISEVNVDDQSVHATDFNSVQKTSEDHADKDANLVSVGDESAIDRSATSQDSNVRRFVADTVQVSSETWQEEGVKNDAKPQLISSLIDVSVDSSSQTDSLEGNWGSVSVLSTMSDLPAVVDAEVIPHVTAEAEETNVKKTEVATESQHSDKSDLFEPPSFMTLVEPSGEGTQNPAALEIQTTKSRQQLNSASLQAGWFPSCTHVASDSPGRKKNEAIMAKVTNWSTGKPHAALKNLLDDAALENKQKPSNPKENLASVIQKDVKMANNESVVTIVDPVMQPKSPGNKEIAKEWNSPAKYPSDIKRERRKGRPYWAQFVCCSSVH